MAEGRNVDVKFALVAEVLIALIFLFIWPGPLKYEYFQYPQGIVRVQRVGGKVEMWKDGKYQKVDSDSLRESALLSMLQLLRRR